MQAYTNEQIQDALARPEHRGWQRDPASGEIYKQYTFGNFLQSVEFVNKVATTAEDLGHHPDILIQYNRVRLSVLTHDAGNGLTELDFKLAAGVNAL